MISSSKNSLKKSIKSNYTSKIAQTNNKLAKRQMSKHIRRLDSLIN